MRFGNKSVNCCVVVIAALSITGCGTGIQEDAEASEQTTPAVEQQPTPEAEPEPASVPPGQYSYFHDGSGNSTKEQLAAICPSLNRVVLNEFTGNPMAAAPWLAGGYLGEIIRNNGISIDTPSVDQLGTCRVRVQFAGIHQGNSVRFDRRCAVTSVEVESAQVAGVRYFDVNDCI